MRNLLVTLATCVLAAACTPGAEMGPRSVVEEIIDDQIIPNHTAFANAAREEQDAIVALCSAPDAARLQSARESFRKAALAWSRIEWLNFGPARQNNRRETLFFWPDNRGRGLRQVQELAAVIDPAQFAAAAFAGKSVSVKGLPALEYVLFDSGADVLLSSGAARCEYAEAIAASIAATAQELSAAWSSGKGYRHAMLSAGPENAEFRNHKEVLQKLLTAAGEQVQIVRDLKLKPLLAQRNGAPSPIAPPFATAGLSFAAVSENLDAASAVFLLHASKLLPEDAAYRAGSLEFEVATLQRALSELGAEGTPATELARSKQSRDRLSYLLLPLDGVHTLMTQVYPSELGLVMGFNSLDGD